MLLCRKCGRLHSLLTAVGLTLFVDLASFIGFLLSFFLQMKVHICRQIKILLNCRGVSQILWCCWIYNLCRSRRIIGSNRRYSTSTVLGVQLFWRQESGSNGPLAFLLNKVSGQVSEKVISVVYLKRFRVFLGVIVLLKESMVALVRAKHLNHPLAVWLRSGLFESEVPVLELR